MVRPGRRCVVEVIRLPVTAPSSGCFVQRQRTCSLSPVCFGTGHAGHDLHHRIPIVDLPCPPLTSPARARIGRRRQRRRPLEVHAASSWVPPQTGRPWPGALDWLGAASANRSNRTLGQKSIRSGPPGLLRSHVWMGIVVFFCFRRWVCFFERSAAPGSTPSAPDQRPPPPRHAPDRSPGQRRRPRPVPTEHWMPAPSPVDLSSSACSVASRPCRSKYITTPLLVRTGTAPEPRRARFLSRSAHWVAQYGGSSARDVHLAPLRRRLGRRHDDTARRVEQEIAKRNEN